METKQYVPGRFLLWIGLTITLLGVLSYFLQFTPAMAEFDPRQAGLIISLVGIALSIWGFVREIRMADIAWEKSLGAKMISISLVLVALYVSQTFFGFHQDEVRFRNGNVVLAGTLLIPNNEGPHPAVIMMHGAGEATRMGNFAEAQSLARHGVDALIFDKRGSGKTVGGHYRFDGYEALASDGVAAFSFLNSRSDINPDQIGLWGPSEGGWTTSMAAAKIDDLAFMIIVSGGPVTPAEQGAYELAYRLSHQEYSDSAVAQAVNLQAQTNWRKVITQISPLRFFQKRRTTSLQRHHLIVFFCVPDAITGIGPSRPWFAPGYLNAVSAWVTQRVKTAD